MPRFFLHLRDGNLNLADPDGIEAADLNAAIGEARRSARWLIKDDLRSGKTRPDRTFVITDKNGTELSTIYFNDEIDKK
jgi:hypothetical protein